MRIDRTLLSLILATSAAPIAHAQLEVPDALEPWRDWVLYGEEYRTCPVLSGSRPGVEENHLCAWPGELNLDVDAGGATFTQTWTVYTDQFVPLPGDTDFWPAGVTVNGGPAPVIARAGAPTLHLEPGSHTVAGRIEWSVRPASLRVPQIVGLVSLRLDGASIEHAELEAGTLWFGLRPEAEVVEDRLNVVAYRLVSDGLPLELTTVIDLDVAGQAREQTLEGAMLAGFTGERLDSLLPAQLEPDGGLRVQLRPGQWRLELRAHAAGLPSELRAPDQVEPWPPDEVWSFEAQSRLRVAALEGGESVDGVRAGVPPAWRQFPSYRVTAGQTLNLVERSRNDASEPNRLSLTRNLWLDFDGGGYTALDRITGSMGSGWRLDMAAPYVMTSATEAGEPMLVTLGTAEGTQGVELRERGVRFDATARLAAGSRMAVSGYMESFDSIRTTLHLPPAERLLAAPGADQAIGAWVDSWRLLDIFLVLIITVAAWRLLGVVPGSITLVAMLLIYHEPFAPRWAWLNLLAAIALFKVAPEGRLRLFTRRYQFVSAIALALLMIPFIVLQTRAVIFPQLEQGFLQRGVATMADQAQARFSQLPAAAALRRAAPEAIDQITAGAEATLEEVTVTAARVDTSTSRVLPGALVQTGPGLPDWAWNRYQLSWGGPIDPDQQYVLVIMPPWASALWRVASIAFAMLAFGLFMRPRMRLPGGWLKGGQAAGGIVLAAMLLSPEEGRAQAASEFPSLEILAILKQRLTTPAECHPLCAEIAAANVVVESNRLEMTLSAAVQDTVAVPIPGSEASWRPSTIVVDDRDVRLLYRDPTGIAWLQLEPGVHELVLSGPMPAEDSFSVPFPLLPRRITLAADGWDVSGISDGRLPSGALNLVRQREQAVGENGERITATVFPPFVRVTRRITFDLDWRVSTFVERVAPSAAAFTLEIDLLPDEAVLTPGIEVEDGSVLAAFGAGQESMRWDSRLPAADTLSLSAPAEASWVEVWQLAVGHIWHADLAGFPATPSESSEQGFYVPEYNPRPGETITASLSRPLPATGDTIAIDAVDYVTSFGARSADASLEFDYRSTQGGEHVITLPADSELDEVRVDGQLVPLQLDDGRLEIQVVPGEHTVRIAWSSPLGASFLSASQEVDLGGGASNLSSRILLPADRWVLLTYGPTLGPAILYWAEIAVFALAAIVLGRLSLSPLGVREWLFLGLGLSTFAWPVLLLFGIWAFVLRWRERLAKPPARFNLMQVLIAALTITTIAALIGSIPVGLLGSPDMQIASPILSGGLAWFEDRTDRLTPPIGVISVSLWYYKAAMLAWALWLSFALLRWLRWAWGVYARDGLWRGRLQAGGE